MNRRELVGELLKRPELAHLKQKDVDRLVRSLLEVIKTTVGQGDSVCLSGFGTFSTTRHCPRLGANPNTGEAMVIEAKTLPHFRPGKTWRAELSDFESSPG